MILMISMLFFSAGTPLAAIFHGPLQDRVPRRAHVSAEEFETDPIATAAGGTTMVMATMTLVTRIN